MSTEELKPCPFCGGIPKIRTEGLDERFAYANQVTIQCPSCGCSRSAVGDTSKPGYADNSTTEQRAIAAWNRRAAPAAGTEKDAERYRALRHLMQSAKGSASLEVNQHLAYYEPAEPGQEVKLQWYPDTPIGFYTIEGATLDDVADEAIEFIEAHTKAGKDTP